MEDEFGIEKTSPGTNRSTPPSECPTCHGDRFVIVRLRPQKQTLWMQEHGIEPNPSEMHEEYAPCPDCHNIEIRYRGFRQLDAGAVREAIR